jgi:photosystem II stability/assembly factor-like uncharacterized protein
MKLSTAAAVILLVNSAAFSQWERQAVKTDASFRGLAVVNEKVAWASGTGGTVIRTVDGGRNWHVITVPGAEKLDFRDIEAFDANTAYTLSIGNGASSRIYKTVDGGKSWELQFTNKNEKAFFDAIACWNRQRCIAMSDPVDGHYVLVSTNDGGVDWKPIVSNLMPAAKDGEAAFAASGTCLITRGKSDAFLVSGGTDARVFRSIDAGQNWTVVDTPIKSAGGGIFSVAVYDPRIGIIVGGDYSKPGDAIDNLALTTDGGKTWALRKGLTGYRSGVTYVDKKTIIAVGTNGSDISRAGGKTWTALDSGNYNAVQAKGGRAIWAVGPKGIVAKLNPSSL